jgi:ATP-dependent Clp protease ATP-binding subunit ClpA
MDYGILTDNQGRKADFRNCMIIMTSNAGARDMEKGGIGFGSQDAGYDEATLYEAVNRVFPPEFRNRLDSVVPFGYLDKDIVRMVCQKEVFKLAQRIQKKKIFLTVTDKCIDYLTEEGYSKEFGARNMARTIEENIANPLVDEVLFGQLSKGGSVRADYKKNKIVFEYGKEKTTAR